MRSPQPKQTRVLVVDPNPMSRQLTVGHLQAAGYDVVSAGTGERAFVLLREWPRRIDWLYTAVELSGLVDGWILADEFHQAHPSRPVLYGRASACSCGLQPWRAAGHGLSGTRAAQVSFGGGCRAVYPLIPELLNIGGQRSRAGRLELRRGGAP